MTEQEKCLTENVADKSVVLGTWQTSNRTNDKDETMESVVVTGPDGDELYRSSSEFKGFFAFRAQSSGAYRACFRAISQGVSEAPPPPPPPAAQPGPPPPHPRRPPRCAPPARGGATPPPRTPGPPNPRTDAGGEPD